jgi:hypothetical protein
VTAPVATASAGGAGWLTTLVRIALLLALVAAVVRWPRTAWRLVRFAVRLLTALVAHVLIRRAATRRRRRAIEVRASAARAQRFARPHHIYDELF